MRCSQCPLLKVTLNGRDTFHHFTVGENMVKGNRLTFMYVQLWSEVNSCVLGVYRSCVLCIQTLVTSSADSAAIVGDSARHTPFLVFIKHSLYPDNWLPWSQHKSEPACKPRNPDLQPKLLLMLPWCPLSLPKSCPFFLFPPPCKLMHLSNWSLCFCRSS